MWVCTSAAVPGYTWTSSSDATDFMPGWTCKKLEEPLPGASSNAWHTMYRIVRLIEGAG